MKGRIKRYISEEACFFMRFDIIDLRLFLNVYKAGSITGGAALSHLTLQSASERIRGMESELGVPLFSRSRKGVKLSDAGYSLVNHANIVLQQVDHMRSELHQYGKGLRGHINLLCNSSAQSEFLPSLIGPYLLSNPNISISVKEMLSHDIVAVVKNQMANLGIVADSTQLNGLASLPFNDDELVVFAPAKKAVGMIPKARRLKRSSRLNLSDLPGDGSLVAISPKGHT